MGSLHREDISRGYGDLRLFNEMRDRQRQKFIYHSKDELLTSSSPSSAISSKYDDGLSCMNGFSPSTPKHNDRSLPLDANKNDYDWLLTPPTTPLFPSLDEDVPLNLSQRRVLTRTASTMTRPGRLLYPQEPFHKMIMENPTPSLGIGSSTSSIVNSSSRRTSSPSCSRRSSPTSGAPRSNPSPLRSPSPYKHSISPGRSRSGSISRSPISRPLTPSPRCNYSNNTSPSSGSPNPVTTSRGIKGKSLSPQFHMWDPSLVGFSTEPPPNLRTSMSDRTIRRGGSQQHPSKEITAQVKSKECPVNSASSSGEQNLIFTHDEKIAGGSKESVISSCGHIEKPKSSTRRDRDVLDDSILKRKISPAKREMKSGGIHGGMTHFPPTTNKPSPAQRRNSQPMFRPLLSSAPVTSSRGLKHRFPSSSSEDFCTIFTGSCHVLPNGNNVSNSNYGKEAPSQDEHSSISQASEPAFSDTISNRPKSLGTEFGEDELGSSRNIQETVADLVGFKDIDTGMDNIDPHHSYASGQNHPEELASCRSEFPTLSPLMHQLEDYEHSSTVGDPMALKNVDSGVVKQFIEETRAADPSRNEQHNDKMEVKDPSVDFIKHGSIQETHLDKLLDCDAEMTLVRTMTDIEMCKVENLSKDAVVHEVMGTKHEGDLCKLETLKRSVTLAEATDTILFCSSIIQELVHTAASLAEQHKLQQNSINLLSSTKEFVTMFGFSGPDEKADVQKALPIPQTRKRQFPIITVQETNVQKQRMRMIHRQSEAITMKQSPTERIGNAVIGNLEDIRAPALLRRKSKQAKRIQCQCNCCMM